MFSTNKRFIFKQNKLITGQTGGVEQRSVSQLSNRKQVTADFFGSGFESFGGANTSMNVYASGPVSNTKMMTGLIPEQESLLRTYYRDIYYYDSVAGSAVDIMSAFPFSDWTLTGAEANQIEKFSESLARLNIRALMPEVSLAYLVDGSFVGTMVFNKQEKVFIDLLIHAIDDCDIQVLPFYSSDPIIKVRNSAAIQGFLKSSEPEVQRLKKLIGPQLVQAMSAPGMKLDSLSTLYVSRRTLPGTEPTSYLKRVLSAYLIEKTLYRGTLVEATKRQRSMLHITMGDDTWEPTPQEMADTVNNFQLADLDPLGAVMATRNGVQATEIRQGGDFWKWTDNVDLLTPLKLRALGISEAFLSGDANFSNVETGMSVFMENCDAYRSYLTYKIFTNKIFPIVAIANGFYKKGKEQSIHNQTHLKYQANNHTDLVIPSVRWHKTLQVRNEDNMMDLLSVLNEKGIPIPLRMWAAASKVDLNTLYQDLAEDNAIKKKIAEITGQSPDDIAKPGTDATMLGNRDGGGDESDDSEGYGEDATFASAIKRIMSPNSVQRKSLLDRNFGEQAEVKGKTKTGKDKYIHNQREANQNINRTIAKVTTALADPNIKAQALKRARKTLGRIPSMLEETMGRI